MDTKDLYEKEDANGESVYYTDEDCTMPYTGHVEEYFKGKLSWESDIIDGVGDGIEKSYYDVTMSIENPSGSTNKNYITFQKTRIPNLTAVNASPQAIGV